MEAIPFPWTEALNQVDVNHLNPAVFFKQELVDAFAFSLTCGVFMHLHLKHTPYPPASNNLEH